MSLPNRIQPAEAKISDARVIDVRTAAEYGTAHIPGSVHIPLSLLEKHPEEVGAALDGDVIIVCRSGARATRAQAELNKVGMTSTSVLEGGIEAWRKAELPVKLGEPRWDLERQVRLVAGSIVASSIAASTVFPKAKWVAAAIGTGLTGAAVTNTCAMGMALSKLPYNSHSEPTLKDIKHHLAA